MTKEDASIFVYGTKLMEHAIGLDHYEHLRRQDTYWYYRNYFTTDKDDPVPALEMMVELGFAKRTDRENCICYSVTEDGIHLLEDKTEMTIRDREEKPHPKHMVHYSIPYLNFVAATDAESEEDIIDAVFSNLEDIFPGEYFEYDDIDIECYDGEDWEEYKKRKEVEA